MPYGSYERLRDIPAGLWFLGFVLVALNVWFDYYHPLGIFFDVVIVAAWSLGAFKPVVRK